MHKLGKIQLDGHSCSDEIITVTKPTVSGVAPFCPFNLFFEITSFDTSSVENTHEGVMWILSLVDTNNNLIPLINLQSAPGELSVKIPEKYSKAATNYSIQAYHVGSKRVSELSDRFDFTTLTASMDSGSRYVLGDTGQYDSNAFYVIETINDKVYALWALAEPYRRNPLFGIMTHTGIDGDNWVMSTGWMEAPSAQEIGGFTPSSERFESNCIASCTDGTNIYYLFTLLSYDTDLYVYGFVDVVLLKFNTVTPAFTVLARMSTHPLLNKDFPGLAYHDNKLYLKGGYSLLPTGQLVTPDDATRTFLQFDLTNNTLSPVEVVGDTKPRDYRGTKLIATSKGLWAFSGWGFPASRHNEGGCSPELWFFDFATKKWIAHAHFPAQAILNSYMDFGMSEDESQLVVVITSLNNSYVIPYFYSLEEFYWEVGSTMAFNYDGSNQKVFFKEGKGYLVTEGTASYS